MYPNQKVFFRAVILSAALGISLPAPAETAPPPAETTLAIVNGTVITQATYDRYLATRPAGSSSDRSAIIEELIKRELVLQDAMKRGLDKQPQVILELATLRENLLVAAGLKAVAENLSSSPDELQKFYSNHLKEMNTTEYKARHILVPTSEEASAIIAELDKGADFIKLAKEKSKDNAADGGDLGWFNNSQMLQPLSEVINVLEKGKYTAQPVHSEFGWHVLLLEDTRENPPPPFEKVQDRIKIAIQRAKLQEYVKNLRLAAKVELKN